MLISALAALALAAVLFHLFRFAMGLRFAKVQREEARAAEEARGRRVLAEIPVSDVEVVFLVDDGDWLRWGDAAVRKDALVGARLKVNGAVLKECPSGGAGLPAPTPPEEYEGRERWEVEVFARDGTKTSIPCGTLREGISREIAGKVFEAVKATIPLPATPAGRGV
jgi:hypothetical protein